MKILRQKTLVLAVFIVGCSGVLDRSFERNTNTDTTCNEESCNQNPTNDDSAGTSVSESIVRIILSRRLL